MGDPSLTIRAANADDLPQVNDLIARAIATWDLPERVKRLALPTYVYSGQDLETLTLLVACAGQNLAGVAAWEPGRLEAQATVSVHGLYVDPQWWGRGVGSRLLAAAEQAARTQGAAAVTVRAQAGARGFFLRHGFVPPEMKQSSDYAHLLWKPLLTSQ